MDRTARREEMEYFAAKKVYKKVPRGLAMEMQGNPPITVKWLDVNKGTYENPNYRSRLVAREVRHAWGVEHLRADAAPRSPPEHPVAGRDGHRRKTCARQKPDIRETQTGISHSHQASLLQ